MWAIVLSVLVVLLTMLWGRRLRTKQVLGPGKRVSLVLEEKRMVSHDTYVFSFGLPSVESVLGVPVGQHIKLVQSINGAQVERKYTPISKVDQKGRVELLIKVYRPNQQYPQGGILSSYMEGLNIGDRMLFQGPLGRLSYLGQGRTVIDRAQSKTYTKFNLIAGGTGITPVYQIIQAVLDHPQDNTSLSLLYANKAQQDILLRQELEHYQNKGLHVQFTLDSPPEDWPDKPGYAKGFISKDMLAKMASPSEDTLNLLCGPFPMVKMVADTLKQMGHSEINIFRF